MIVVFLAVIMAMITATMVTMVTGHRLSFRNYSWFQLVSHQTPYATGFATDAKSPPVRLVYRGGAKLNFAIKEFCELRL